MYRGHTTAVVVPAYNETGFVGDTIESVPAFVDRIYAIDDASTDDTWAEIQETSRAVNDRHDSESFPERVVPIQHEQNRGVGGAIKTGYLRARDDRIDVTAVMGGDGQMEPEMLGDLFDPIIDGSADYTKGNRFLERTDSGDMPTFRFVGNTMLTALTKVASGYWRNGDSQNGYTAISLRALETADIESMYEFYGYCNDILAKLNVAGMRVVDVASPIRYGDEESDIRYRTYIPRVAGMLARNFLWRVKTNYLVFDFHPLVGAYAAGGVASLLSVLLGLWALPGVGAFATPWVRGAVAVAFGLVGLLSFVFAMVLDAAANEDLSDSIHPAGPRTPAGTPAETSTTSREAPSARQSTTSSVEREPRDGVEAEGERGVETRVDSDFQAAATDSGNESIAVTLEPHEWGYILGADTDDEPSTVAARIRERIVRKRRQADTAAD